ncbi:hypothetical protein [Gorillibacterium timonense]|nr:hypothetical protein [Gorillibacterium timonense]
MIPKERLLERLDAIGQSLNKNDQARLRSAFYRSIGLELDFPTSLSI